MASADQIKSGVSEFYANRVEESKGCCGSGGKQCYNIKARDQKEAEILAEIHPDIIKSFFGCGSPIPPYSILKNASALDLGCGTGRDVYLLSKLVGENGLVVGIDMTDKSLDVAKSHVEYHKTKFGFSRPNVSFVKGNIEDLKAAKIADNSMDFVLSNCVINLVPDKKPVFEEIYRVLRPGGELYFADIYTDEELSPEARLNTKTWNTCLSGALSEGRFNELMKEVGFADSWIVSDIRVDTGDLSVEQQALLGDVQFYSRIIRAFKVEGLNGSRMDYGETCTYVGGCSSLEEEEDVFWMDKKKCFKKGVSTRIDGNTAQILRLSHYSTYFAVSERGEEVGIFKEKCCGGKKKEGGCCKDGGGKRKEGGCCKDKKKKAEEPGCCGGGQKKKEGGCCGGGKRKEGGCCKDRKKEEVLRTDILD